MAREYGGAINNLQLKNGKEDPEKDGRDYGVQKNPLLHKNI
jgi:hypothetical protein